MKKEIVINETADQVRIAITEDSRLAEIFVDTPGKERMVGSMGRAFVFHVSNL